MSVLEVVSVIVRGSIDRIAGVAGMGRLIEQLDKIIATIICVNIFMMI